MSASILQPVLWLAVLAAVAACPRAATQETREPARMSGVRLVEVASGLASPVHLASPPGDARLFVVEQDGRIRIVRDGVVLPRPFLDLSDRVRSGGERGLLSIAFHPSFATNGSFFVNYTDAAGDTRIERYRVSTDPDVADPSSARLILRVEQPFANHNGGHIFFGPDGLLYVGTGDGGGAGDPRGHGQNRNTLLGAMLRLDVDRGDPYAVPQDNPFVSDPSGRDEIWAWGLRNPWRSAFDRETGLLYVADVGQNRWEEISVVPALAAGLNFGWNRVEGSHCFTVPRCSREELILPVLEYGHAEGCSVTGGLVYRGRLARRVVGHYFFSDFCAGWLRSFRYEEGRARDYREWDVGRIGSVTSFGEDGAGELHILTAEGRVVRLESQEGPE
ncbi:MAG: PQQ-dependent sugar dehydrogenase [Gemmatimonadota bacterium]